MTNKPQGHGYVAAQVVGSNPFFAEGTILRGHEFHNSRLLTDGQSLNTSFKLSRGIGLGNGLDGIVIHNVLASYMHLHTGGTMVWAESLVKRAKVYRESCLTVGNQA
jgi:cobyrinic acid a,c-diamide synthase